MPQVIVNKVVLENGQKVYEAVCPADPTIKPRRPIKESKQNEVDHILDNASIDSIGEEDAS